MMKYRMTGGGGVEENSACWSQTKVMVALPLFYDTWLKNSHKQLYKNFAKML